MVVVPAGEFMMGTPAGEPPQHKVTIANPFAVGKFEVTFAEWDACVAERACELEPEDNGWGRERRPVINVSWYSITAEYIPWLSKKTGRVYRLLTEAEWEYSARAGTTTRFSTGDTIRADQANFNGNYGKPEKDWRGTYPLRTLEVGSFKPNAFGLYDVHGNVEEWVEDCYHDSYAGAHSDGSAVVTDNCERVYRGGNWFHNEFSLPSASRMRATIAKRSDIVGFRVARSIGP
jgi:formylglycine-generating enzyme required for sulfatase activity